MPEPVKTNTTPDEKKTISLYDIYEEKREYPRISLNAIASLSLPDGFDVSIIVHDMSPDGIQLRCNRKTAHMIHPSGQFITEATAPGLDIRFNLNVDNSEREILAHIKLFYFTIISEDTVAFGARFIRFDKFTDRHVDRFITNAMSPVEEKVLDMLDKPRSEQYIVERLGESAVNLDDTLNMLKKKKAIISCGDDKKQKYIRMESALQSLYTRIERLEQRLAELEAKTGGNY